MEFKFIWQKARFRSWIWDGIAGCCTWKSESKILDLGCGTGTLTTQLTNFAGTVIGVDSSYDMIEKARSQFNNIEKHYSSEQREEIWTSIQLKYIENYIGK